MKIKLSIIPVLAIACAILAGCGQGDAGQVQTAAAEALPETAGSAQPADADMFTSRDMNSAFDDSAITIKLENGSAACESEAVSISGGVITLSREGSYLFSGSLEEGMIIVDAPKDAKLQLVLQNAHISSSSSAAIYVRQADKVFLTLADGTENSLSNGGSFTALDENNIDGAIWSKEDMSINGGGKLSIASPAGHGIVCKDDLVIYGGELDVTAAEHGIDANDSVRIGAGSLSIDSGKDGIHAETDDDEELGFVYMAGGETDISCGDDGIHAGEYLKICAGSLNIAESLEGLEALRVYIEGGEINIRAEDDGINAAGGTASGSPEGGFGGGIPAQGGMGGPAGYPGHGGPGAAPGAPGIPGGAGGAAAMDSKGEINISGGRIYIVAYGDGLDANGSISISGGDTVVCGPVWGDTATLDYDVSAIVSGGSFIGTGAYGMAQSFSGSEQGLLAVSTGNRTGGTELRLEDENGELILSHTPELDYAVVIISSPDIISGETYRLYVGSDSAELQAK